MRLTSFTDYSLRVLLYAEAHQEALFTIDELAGVFSVSRAHLMKVVSNLTREGYLEAIRGRAGGLRIKMDAKDINIGTLIEQTEPDFCIVECMRQENGCLVAGRCKLQPMFGAALGAFREALSAYTLADVVLNRDDFLPSAAA